VVVFLVVDYNYDDAVIFVFVVAMAAVIFLVAVDVVVVVVAAPAKLVAFLRICSPCRHFRSNISVLTVQIRRCMYFCAFIPQYFYILSDNT
jgi:hypothetical protein